MLRRVHWLLALAFLCLFGAGLAAAEAAMPDLLRQALEKADARSYDGMRLKFVRTKLGPPDEALSAAFDPNKAEGEQWVILSPAPDKRSDDQAAAIKTLLGQSNSDLELLIDSRAAHNLLSDDLRLKAETDSDVTYEASVRELPGAKGMFGPIDPALVAKHLKAQITIDRTTLKVTAMRIFAPKAFKPILAAKFDRFEIAMQVGEAWTGGPLAVTHVDRDVTGDAFYLKFGEQANLQFSRFEEASKKH